MISSRHPQFWKREQKFTEISVSVPVFEKKNSGTPSFINIIQMKSFRSHIRISLTYIEQVNLFWVSPKKYFRCYSTLVLRNYSISMIFLGIAARENFPHTFYFPSQWLSNKPFTFVVWVRVYKTHKGEKKLRKNGERKEKKKEIFHDEKIIIKVINGNSVV